MKKILLVLCFAGRILSLPLKSKNVEIPQIETPDLHIKNQEALYSEVLAEGVHDTNNNNRFKGTLRNTIRPGIVVNNYAVEITPNVNSGTFAGRLVAQVAVTDQSTREDEIKFHVSDLNINSVTFSIASGSTLYNADYFINDDDGLLEISTNFESTLYTFIIEYQGVMGVSATGLFMNTFSDG